MQYAVYCSKAFPNLLKHLSQLCHITNVTLHQDEATTALFKCEQTLEFQADVVLRLVFVEPCLPLIARRQPVTAHQNNRRLICLPKMLSQNRTNATQTAGNQVDASLAEGNLLCRNLSQWNRLIALNQALLTAISHQCATAHFGKTLLEKLTYQ